MDGSVCMCVSEVSAAACEGENVLEKHYRVNTNCWVIAKLTGDIIENKT